MIKLETMGKIVWTWGILQRIQGPCVLEISLELPEARHTFRHGPEQSNIQEVPAFIRKKVAAASGIPGVFPAAPEGLVIDRFWRRSQ